MNETVLHERVRQMWIHHLHATTRHGPIWAHVLISIVAFSTFVLGALGISWWPAVAIVALLQAWSVYLQAIKPKADKSLTRGVE